MELHNLGTALLEWDGSCRDVNFEGVTWAGVDTALRYLKESFSRVSATNGEGRSVLEPLPTAIASKAREGEHLHVVLAEGTDLFTNLQISVWGSREGSPFVEVTFFPADLRARGDVKHEFLTWVNKLRSCLQARRYYVRYENASWTFGDTGELSGVILVSDELGVDA